MNKGDNKTGAAAKDEQEEHQPELDEDLNGDGGEEEKHDEEGKGDDKHDEHHDIGDDVHDLGGEANAGDNAQTSEQDARSVYVKNVDYSSTKEEVTDFFKSCGKINRVTIITDKYTGNPKGFAYIEFTDKESVESALFLSESTFKGRTITVIPKRTNVPFRGRGGRGRRFGGRGGGYFPMRRGFGMFGGRPMRRGFRPY